jgi:hypothetical protein
MTNVLLADEEAVVDGIAEELLSPAFLDALKTEWESRPISVPFRSPEVVYPDEIENPPGYPCGEVILIASDDNDDSGAEDLTHEISVQWSIAGDTELVMARQLKRYIRATRRYFRGQRMFPHVRSGVVRTGRADYSPTVATRQPTAGSRFIKSAALTLFVQTMGR